MTFVVRGSTFVVQVRRSAFGAVSDDVRSSRFYVRRSGSSFDVPRGRSAAAAASLFGGTLEIDDESRGALYRSFDELLGTEDPFGCEVPAIDAVLQGVLCFHG